jgi:hypothetical protein
MTPTERAYALMREIGALCYDPSGCENALSECTCMAEADAKAVADHIRRAENDALERVASWLDKTRYSSALAKDVRAMKSEVKG